MTGLRASSLSRERMARHGFADRPARTVAAAATLDCGIQAQDLGAARLAVRSRSGTLTDAAVDRALTVHRSVVRTWLMRNTIHLVAAADVRWLARLLGPMVRRRFETRRWPGLGLTPQLLDAAAAATPDVLGDGPLTRRQFAAALRERGVPVPGDGQAPVHLLLFLATLGLTCHADGDRFALLADWLPGAPAGPDGDDALAELARRWFAAYSPATPADFAAWSGLPAGPALALIRDLLTPVDVGGRPGYRLGAAVTAEGVRLLGGFDSVLVGYRHRDALIAPEHRDRVYVGGVIRPAVLRDGVVVGRWRLERARSAGRPVRIEVELFGAAAPGLRAGLAVEADDVGRFLDRPAELSLWTPPPCG